MQAIEENRLFILDYHDIILPFIKKINALPGRKVYASRTVFLHSQTGTLTPIAIELSLPPTPSSKTNKHVYTHGHDATTYWIWKLAKAHVCSVDAGIHQLVNHWYKKMHSFILSLHMNFRLQLVSITNFTNDIAGKVWYFNEFVICFIQVKDSRKHGTLYNCNS